MPMELSQKSVRSLQELLDNGDEAAACDEFDGKGGDEADHGGSAVEQLCVVCESGALFDLAVHLRR